MRYNCDMCGCYLDPDEGLLCDDCRQVLQARHHRAEIIREAVRDSDGGQMEMNLQEVG